MKDRAWESVWEAFREGRQDIVPPRLEDWIELYPEFESRLRDLVALQTTTLALEMRAA